MTTINFYRTSDPYGEFSNFYKAIIEIDKNKYSTTEHYFQAMKYNHNPEYFEKIKNAYSPSEAAKLGRSRKYPLRTDWEKVKDNIMMIALKAKFNQHPNLKKILINTGNAILVEHTKNDSYWGDGGDGTGKNMLGKSLMILRSEFIKENQN